MEAYPESKRLCALRIKSKNATTSDDYGDCLMELCEIVNDIFLLQAEENEANTRMFHFICGELEIILDKSQKQAVAIAYAEARQAKKES